MSSWTLWFREQYRGVELLCDSCNCHSSMSPLWWYYRSNKLDRYPSMWICNECKEMWP